MTNDLADRIADSILARIEQDKCVHKSSVADEVRKHLAVHVQQGGTFVVTAKAEDFESDRALRDALRNTKQWYRINPSGIGPDARAAVDLEDMKAAYAAEIMTRRYEEMIHPHGAATVGALPQTEG